MHMFEKETKETDGNDSHSHSHSHSQEEFASHEFTSLYFSPEGDPRTPPQRMSTQSLVGEDIVSSSTRRNSPEHVSVDLSPFTPPNALLPIGPNDIQIPESLSPPSPPMNNNHNIIETGLGQHSLPKEIQQQSGHSGNSPIFRAPGGGGGGPGGGPGGNNNNNNSANNSRPPRVPHVPLQPTGRSTADNRHGRVPSNTDYSILSALTESPSDFSVPKRRTLSWDINDSAASIDHRRNNNESPGAASYKSTPAALLQPVLIDEPNHGRSTTIPPESIFTSSRTGTGFSDPSTSIHSSFARITREGIQNQSIHDNNNESFRTPPNPKSNIQFQGLDVLSGSSDTGSFVRTTKATTEPNNNERRNVTPESAANDSKHYTLQEVLGASPKEGDDETQVLKNIESQQPKHRLSGSQTMQKSMGMIDDNIVNALGGEEQILQTSSSTEKTTNQSMGLYSLEDDSSNTLNGLTKRLAAVTSPTHDPTDEPPKRQLHMRRSTKTQGVFVDDMALNVLSNSSDEDVEVGGGLLSSLHGSPKNSTTAHRPEPKNCISRFWRSLKNDFYFFVDFCGPSKNKLLYTHFLWMFKVVVMPSFLTAVFLFYVAGNPPTGTNNETATTPSISWWLLFLGVRLIITLGLAVFTELVIVQFWTFRTKLFPKFLGPQLSLLVAHSRGWPHQLVAWAIINLCLLQGDDRFAHHWLFWQDAIGLFNASNPSGNVVNSKLYLRVLMSGILLGTAEALKRVYFGTSAGKHLVAMYGNDLTKLVYKLVLVSEVANLPLFLEDLPVKQMGVTGIVEENVGVNGSFDYSEGGPSEKQTGSEQLQSTSKNLSDIAYLLGEWDEPELQESEAEAPTIASILQFRKTLGVISDAFPFSTAFGSALTREECVHSSQLLYDRLARKGLSDLDFELLCKVAERPDGMFDRAKGKELKRIFRPNSTGHISKIEFVKSIDSVYKQLRMLLASINNSSQIDRAYESLVGACFNFMLGFIILGLLGVDINALFIFLTGLVVSFAFLIGSASSKYFEGILFILARKPYDIGDRIEIGIVTDVADPSGPTSSVIVEKVDLYTTTVRVGTTREVCTFSNGSLANTRVMNLRKSERANVYMNLKFGVDATTDQLEEFTQRVFQYTKDHPREWSSVVACRCIRIEVDLGFIEYHIALQHRDSWQSLPGIQQSKGRFLSFVLETQKLLGIKYSAPRVPIDVLPAGVDRPSEPNPFERSYSRSYSDDPALFEPKKYK